ncbi:MAG: hypothetical protein RLZZ142_861 [Verrucomicrobiota bacterium]
MVWGQGPGGGVFGAEPAAAFEPRGFLEQYCVSCHGEEKQKGKVRLDTLLPAIGDLETAERWQKVLNAINAGEMPPEEERQPKGEEKAVFLEQLSEAMVQARRRLSDSGGVLTMRRLNKREYQNTLRELLGVPVDAKDLPNDGGGGSFDTAGKALFLASDQFEQYVLLARRALDQAIATGPRPVARKVRVEVEEEANRRITGILRGYQMGGYRANKEWKASKGRPTTDFGIVDEGEMKFRQHVWDTNTAPMIDYLTREETRTGALLTIHEPNGQVAVAIPDEMPPGRYRIRARLGLSGRVEASRGFVEMGFRGKALNDAMTLIDCRRVTAPIAQGEEWEVELELPRLTVPLKEDIGPETKKRIWVGERVIALRERQPNTSEASSARYRQALETTGFGVEPALWVDWMEWEGPLVEQWPPAGHAALFFKGEGAEKNEGYAREILERFASRAFRGKPVRASYLERLVGHYRERREAGDGFEEALKQPLSIVLASPSFLYLSEPAAEPEGRGGGRRVDARELATRLAYFLWSGPPDAELQALADSGLLLREEVLGGQVDRMLASERIGEFVKGFVPQWLHMERLDFFQFSHRLYPGFDDSVKRAARREVLETFATVLREQLPAGTLLRSDFVVVNDLLAQFYGLEGVWGGHFRKVSVPEGSPRGGLLGMAAVLAMGSDGERSSPVERGAWVLRKLLHRPPPPAPANVPQLSRHAGKLLSARELLTAHMEEAQCAQCHRKIDPIGYGMEHFDAVGQWREVERTEVVQGGVARKSKEHPIDASGRLPDGTAFQDYFGLRAAVSTREADFVRGVGEQLLEYALGRPVGFSDEETLEALTREPAGGRVTLASLVRRLVLSPVFQRKL